MRDDVKLHLVFAGAPDPCKHLELEPWKNKEIKLSKKDLLWVVKKLLFKYRQGKKNEPFAGYAVEKKDLIGVVSDIVSDGRKVFVLDPSGKSIKDADLSGDVAFVLGDQEGVERKDLRKLKKIVGVEFISLGQIEYLASQVISIVQYEKDSVE